jgi:Asp-tRNA(Asn)/Glu-tRNA(Gln) amidotransferase C subunit
VKLKITPYEPGTNFADFARRFQLIIQDACVKPEKARTLLCQSLPHSMQDEFWDQRDIGKDISEILEYFSEIYQVDTEATLEREYYNIRQGEGESINAFHVRWLQLMRKMAVNRIRPTPELEKVTFIAKTRNQNQIRMMRPTSVLQAVKFATELASSGATRAQHSFGKPSHGWKKATISSVQREVTSSKARPSSSGFRCFNCGEGHPLRKCKKPKDQHQKTRFAMAIKVH